MENYAEVAEKIRTEIKGSLDNIEQTYLSHFDADTERFIDLTANAFLGWRKLDDLYSREKKKDVVVLLVYCSIHLQIISMRLFLTGYLVAAGNMQRQVLESIALAFLCSSKSLTVLDDFIKDKYSSSKAVDHALRKYKEIKVKKDALEDLKKSRDYYHMYSHPTSATIFSYTKRIETEPGLYVGASFDRAKLDTYKNEMAARVNLVGVYPSFISVVKNNLSEW